MPVSALGAWVIIVTPRMVIRELTQPMTPRYIMCIAAAISGPKASPKVCTRSCVEMGDRSAVKNP